jgi:hypothetical protein
MAFWMTRMRSDDSDQADIDEMLDAMDHALKRLRLEYEQYFAGIMKRPPQVLQGKVQKMVLKFASQPPRNTRQKFRFNQLNSRYQVYRQQWGRTMRQIEDGTYRPHRFRAKMRVPGVDAGTSAAPATAESKPAPRKGVDALYDAYVSARRKAGEHAPGPDRAKLETMLRKQTAAIREQHGSDARVKFKVVVENGKAKVKASVSKS